MSDTDPGTLLRDLTDLRDAVLAGAEDNLARWQGWCERADYRESAANFAHYLALRQHDIRPLQRQMMAAGLSSLGRAESRVLPSLDAVLAMLRAATGVAAPPGALSADAFFAGSARIAARSAELFGPAGRQTPVRLLVTLPSTAAEDAGFLLRLAEAGVEAVRINCAHDDQAAWAQMIAHVAAAAEVTGRRMKVFMDLAGPKIRTGELRKGKGVKRVSPGDELAITLPGRLEHAPRAIAAIECTLPEALQATLPGQRIYLDDGKLGTLVTQVEPWGVITRVETGPEETGYKLKPEKGINFPDTDFATPALTDDDRADLPFVAHHADAIEFSFVQSPEDVAALQLALAIENPENWHRQGLVLKIETSRAVRNLPDMLVRAAGRQPTAVMIARGDLAVEIGFARLAEMQEEILWLGEAAQVPVIWATQVLESYLKTGTPSRGEMTDAAMAARAECVMLNKGPHLFEAIRDLDRLLARMGDHIAKKTPLLRPLHSW